MKVLPTVLLWGYWYHYEGVNAWIPLRPKATPIISLLSVSSSSSDAAATSLTAEEEEFLQNCETMCAERNLPLQKVKNCRDLSSVRNSPIKPNRIYRMGRLSDATEADIELLFNQVNLTTIVDLRSPTELKEDPTLFREAVFANFTNLVWKEQGRGRDGCVKELPPGKYPVKSRASGEDGSAHGQDDRQVILDEEFCIPCSEDPNAFRTPHIRPPHKKERIFVSMMNEWKYVKGTASKLRKRDITKAIMKSPGALVSRRVRSSIKKPFLDEINDGGLPMLNELLLRFGAPGIKYVLELCSDATRHPIAFHCTAGKDRTGVIAAIILGLCGVQPEDIVEDYSLSANVYAQMNDHQAMVGALSQRNLDPKTFLGAPPSVMREILEAINENYGSVQGYCNWIGFGPEKQKQLVEACTGED
eukprot:scaffold6586_cov138-Amphora_coffeaeformis.AAC.2